MYYSCHEHKRAFPSWAKFVGHWNFTHHGEPRPAQEEVMSETLPEGYEFQAKKPPPRTAETPPAPVAEMEIPDQLPEDFMERVKLSLNVQRIPEALTQQIINTLKLHPETHDSPNNFGNLLLNILTSSTGGRQHIGKVNLIIQEVFGQAVQSNMPYFGVGQPQPTMPYFGVGQQGQPYAPYSYGMPSQPYPSGYGPPYSQPPTPQGLPSETKPSPAILEIRQALEAQQDQISQLTKALTETEEKKRQAETAQTFQAIQENMNALSAKIEQIAAARDKAETEDKYERHIAELRNQLGQGRGLADEERQRLEKAKTDAEDQLRKLQEERIVRLEAAVETAKQEKGPVTSEIDAITRLAERGIDEMGKARQDIRTVVTSPHTAQRFSPVRTPSSERQAAGEKLAGKVEKVEEQTQEEDSFFNIS